MELIPCSHVGHLYRVSTYSFDGDASLIRDTNNVRLVEVWMDDLKHLFYAANPRNKCVKRGIFLKYYINFVYFRYKKSEFR